MADTAKFSVLFAAIVAAVFVLIGGTAPASAHAGHDHAAASSDATPAKIVSEVKAIALAQSAEPEATSQTGGRVFVESAAKIPQPLQQGSCCCGSVACHAAVAAAQAGPLNRERFNEKVDLPPVIGAAKTNSSGIDRPPRGSGPL
jgi:hypothetical protein